MEKQIEVDADELAHRGNRLAEAHARLSGGRQDFDQATGNIGRAFGDLDVCDAAASEYTAMSQEISTMLGRLRAEGERHVHALLDGAREYRSTTDFAEHSARRLGDAVRDL